MSPDLLQFIQLLAEPTLLVTSRGVIRFANSATATLLGVPRDEVIEVELASLVADAPEKLTHYLNLSARSRQLLPGSLTWIRKPDEQIATRCDSAVIVPRDEFAEALLVLRCRPKAESTDQFVLLNQKIRELSHEILERKKAEQQRDELLQGERAARLDAERASRLKDEFLATLSHELRTPLNAILGWAQIISLQPNIPPAFAQGIEVIGRSARTQARLIEDLLDMSRIISGKIRLDVQRVHLAPVIEAAVATVMPSAQAKEIRVQVTLDPIAGPVKGDPSRLQQVVWNLLSNAVKFTPKTGRIQVSLERVNSHLEIIVSDTGEGIEPAFLPHVFDRFAQADASTTRRHGGLGLGLSLVKQLVELHGGTVRVRSPGQGMGSTFAVALPLLILHDRDACSAASSSSTDSVAPVAAADDLTLRGVRALVVDDEPDARELVKQLLIHHDAMVETAGSAEEALSLLRGGTYGVLLSDIGMPHCDGYELIRRIRALPAEQGGRTPAMALTAFARSEDRTRAIIAGFQAHLAKPIEPSELVAMVRSLAQRI